MKILLWAPIFFGYEIQIKNALVAMGYQVYLIYDRPFKSSVLRAITTKFPSLTSKILTPYYKKKLRNIPKNLDFILVINGQTLTPLILNQIISMNANAKKILYLWDSIKNRKNVINHFKKFDRVLSFDLQDCKRFKLIYRPLFYSTIFNNISVKNKKKKKDKFIVGFLGTIHSDRLQVIDKFLSSNPSLKLKKFMYLHKPWVFILKYFSNKKFRSFKIDDFEYSPLSLDESVSFLSECDIILDIEHLNQTGLTIRTLECIGLNKRLITTNISVCKHDFFESNSVFILDRENPVVTEKFIKEDRFKGFSDNIRNKYSINGWINDVFEL